MYLACYKSNIGYIFFFFCSISLIIITNVKEDNLFLLDTNKLHFIKRPGNLVSIDASVVQFLILSLDCTLLP